MIKSKHESEIAADEFDLKLFGLVSLATNLAVDHDGARQKEWKGIAVELSALRPRVRRMMNARDRGLTEQ